MKMLIVGAGVIGSVYATRLSRAGHDVTLLARDRLYDDLKRDGIVLKNGLRDRK